MTEAIDRRAMALLDKCREHGIISADGDRELLDVDLIESGILDSMSLTMLAALLKDRYQFEVDPSQFVMELRSFNAIAERLGGA